MKFLVFQHSAVEHPGLFREIMHKDGVSWDAVRLDAGQSIPPLVAYDVLLVFGGAMNVWDETEHPWLIAEKAAIRSFVNELRRPFLGICLGHQLLADALGGSVGRMPEVEIGISELRLTAAGKADPLFGTSLQPMNCVQWHGAHVIRLPESAVLLAENDACAVQAMRVGDRAYGLQYHAEADEERLADWGKSRAYQGTIEKLKGPGGHVEVERILAQRIDAFRAAAQAIYQHIRHLVAARMPA